MGDSDTLKAAAPELTKEEYVRFELTKAYMAARPGAIATVIRSDVNFLAEGVLHPDRIKQGATDDAKKV